MTGVDQLCRILGALCPMFMLVDQTGQVVSAGPTLRKLRPEDSLIGRRFLELFHLTRPRAVTSMQELVGAAGGKLHLRFRDPPCTALKGVVAPLEDGGAIVNLSFGISVLDAVRDYALNSADFSATDLTIELLYLVEAKSAAMEASRSLNLRLQGAMIAAEEQAFTDTLTGLKNRRAVDHILDRLVHAGMPFALMHLDLDHFKQVNDTLGHAAGDHVLQEAARIMVSEIRDDDMVGRIGGDEFVLVFQRLRDRKRLDAIAARLIARLEEPIPFNGETCRISASIGIALMSTGGAAGAAELLDQADQALYAAKRAGRGRHRFHCDVAGDAPQGTETLVPSS